MSRAVRRTRGECGEGSRGYAQVCRKRRGPAFTGPLLSIRKVAGSTPARGANYYSDPCRVSSTGTVFCVEVVGVEGVGISKRRVDGAVRLQPHHPFLASRK